MMDKLNYTNVTFDAVAHTYTLPDGRQLSGVTALLSRQLFADKYKGISDRVLSKAAEHGHMVHEAIDFFDTFGSETDIPELRWYRKLKEEQGFVSEANEYLVTDGCYVATSIDNVYEGGILGDVKTTSRLDRYYLSWQLSLNAYLFELQNPGRKVTRLVAIWLPKPRYGSPAVVDIERISSDDCKALIEADARGQKYVPKNMPEKSPVRDIDVPRDVIDEVCSIEQAMREAKQRYDKLRDGLMLLMAKNGCKSFKSDRLTMTYKEGGIRVSVDSAKLKNEFPEVYAAVVKESAVSPSLTIKVI